MLFVRYRHRILCGVGRADGSYGIWHLGIRPSWRTPPFLKNGYASQRLNEKPLFGRAADSALPAPLRRLGALSQAARSLEARCE